MKLLIQKCLIISYLITTSCFADVPPFPHIAAGGAPSIELEEYTNENGEKFKALAFATVPGVVYTIEKSNDLNHWTKLESYYGYGQRIITPMVKLPETTASSTSGNPPPALPPLTPAKIVGISMRFATGGGLILSWSSLDDSTQKTHHFANLALNPEWDNYIAYCRRVENYFFCFGFPYISSAPVANVAHGLADTAMLACFEANFSAMESEMADSVERAKLYVPVSPAMNINNAGFYRVHADWYVDTDADFTEDWLEWENLRRIAFDFAQSGGTGAPPYGATADPYSSDANSNGVWDTLEADDDHDGIFNFKDADKRVKAINWKTQNPLRFAVFPIFTDSTTAGDSLPIQINNRGEVLILKPEDDSTHVVGQVWNRGNFTNLFSRHNEIVRAQPRAIFDSGVVFGTATFKVNGQEVPLQGTANSTLPSQSFVVPAIPATILSRWDTGGLPLPLKNAETYLIAPNPIAYDVLSPASLTSKQNQLLAETATLEGTTTKWFAPITEDGLQIWKVENDLSITQQRKNIEAEWISVDDALATPEDEPAPNAAPSIVLHGKNFPVAMDHTVLLPNGILMIMHSQNPKKNVNMFTEAALMRVKENEWVPFPNKRLSDFSTNGHFSSSYDSVWHDGNDWGIPQLCPGMIPADLENVKLVDTTLDGWTLMLSLDAHTKCQRAFAASPVILSEDLPYTGLDEQSLRARKNESGFQNEYWAMVPAGAGEAKFHLKSAACITTPITLEGDGLTFTPSPITQANQLVTVTAAAGNTIDKPVTMKIANVPSSSFPLKAKVMKPRVVKISILPTGYTAPQGTFQGVNVSCGTLPTAAEIKAALDGIFQPQINVTFDVHIRQEIFRESDIATRDDFLYGDERGSPPWHYNIPNFVRADHKFDLAYDAKTAPGELDIPIPTRESHAVQNNRSFQEGSHLKIYVLANLLKDEPTQPGKFLQVLAHEIGHHFFGPGHPGNLASPGVAGLGGSQQYKRLMYQNISSKPAPHIMRQCVKAEWDKAEEWLDENIKND